MGSPVMAETLADIRQDLAILSVEMQKLKRELSTTGASGVAIGGTQLDRITSIESELQRLTAKSEQLEFRILQVTKDGTARLRDLEFRICEMEEGCDIANLPSTRPIGGEVESETPVETPPKPQTPQLAVQERGDFNAAQQALDVGDFSKAAKGFATFRETYPAGPLEVRALIGEGLALSGIGDTREAARRFLGAYSGYPQDPDAAEALWRLGGALADLGSKEEACVTLAEVTDRYPESDFVAKAQTSLSELGCK
jgi:tol-pal system protein YbgF